MNRTYTPGSIFLLWKKAAGERRIQTYLAGWLFILLSLVTLRPAMAQCDSHNGTISVVPSGGSMNGATLAYVLTNPSGTILTYSATPTFTGIADGTYQVYAVGYTGTQPFRIGQPIASVTTGNSCVQYSAAPVTYNVCTDALACDSQNGTLTLNASGGNMQDATLGYILTSSTGAILQTSTTPAFTGVSTGSYFVYGVGYTTAAPPYTVGQSISVIATNDTCARLTTPVFYKICLPPVMPVIRLEVPMNTSGERCLLVSNPNNATGFTAAICSQPSSGTASVPTSFTGNQVCVTYTPPTNFAGDAGSICVVITDPVGQTATTQVPVYVIPWACCGNPTSCDSRNGTITVTSTGGNLNGATLAYVAADTAQVIRYISSTPSFTGVSDGMYWVYAVGYTTSPAPFSIGSSISTITTVDPCAKLSPPVFYHVCPPQQPPVITSQPITTPVNTVATVCLPVSDPDGPTSYTAAICGQPGSGTASVPASFTGNQLCVTYTPPAGFTGNAGSVCVVITDPTGLTATTTVPVSVTTSPNSSTTCDSNNGTVTVQASGGSIPAGVTVAYVLTNPAGSILQTSATPTFTGVSPGGYRVYAVGYTGTTVPFTTGQVITSVPTGGTACVQYSSTPITYNVCSPNSTTACDSQDGSFTVPAVPEESRNWLVRNPMTPPPFESIINCYNSLAYVATNAAGTILYVSRTSSFSGVAPGTYQIYPTTNPIGSIIGQNINTAWDNIADNVCDWVGSAPYTVVVCPPNSTTCDSNNGTIAVTATGGSMSGATLRYVVTNASGQILLTSATPSFTGVAAGIYNVYAVGYTNSTMPYSIGDNISEIATRDACAKVSLPVAYTVCSIPTQPPVITPQPITTPVNTVATVCLPVSDPDGTTSYTAAICGQPSSGTASVPTSFTGNQLCVTYMPPTGFTGNAGSICVVITDPTGQTATTSVPVTVQPASCDSQNGMVVVSATGGSIPAGVTLAYVLTNPAGTILQTSSAPSFSGVAAGGYRVYAVGYTTATAPYSVGGNISTVTTTDACAKVSPGVSYSVCPAPAQPPVITPGSLVTTRDTPATVCLPVSDPDGTTSYTAAICGQPSSGTASVPASFTGNQLCVTYTPPTGFTGNAGSICVVITDPTGQTATTNVPVNVLPSSCDSQNGTVTIAAAGGSIPAGVTLAYVLTNPAGTVLQTSGTPSFSGVAPGNYQVYAMGYTGSSAPFVIGQNINTVPLGGTICTQLSATPLPYRVCPPPIPSTCDFNGNTITLNTAGGVAPAGGSLAYLLTNESGMILQTATTPTFSVSASGGYYVYPVAYVGAAPYAIGQNVDAITFGSNCGALSATPTPIRVCDCNLVLSVNVNSLTVCAGQEVAINYTTNPSGNLVKWTRLPDNGLGIGNVLDFPAITGTVPVSYTYVASAATASGCQSNTVATVVTVNPVPVVTPIACSQTICSGQSASLTFESNTPGTIIQWLREDTGETGTGNISQVITSPTSITISYKVWGTNPGAVSCPTSTTSTYSVVVNPVPVVTAGLTAGSGCLGKPLSLSASVADTQSTANYVWSGPNGFTAVGANPLVTASATQANAGTYTVTATNANGCSATAIVSATVQSCTVCQAPLLTVSTPLCNSIGTGYTVTASHSAGSILSANGGTVSGNIITVSGTNSVTVTATNACDSTSTLTVLAPATCPILGQCPATPTLSVGQPVCLNGSQYQVSFASQNGTVTTSTASAVISGNTVTAPIGTSFIIRVAGLTTACGSYSIAVDSPTTCPTSTTECTGSPLVSVSGPVCGSNGTYRITVSLPEGVTVTSSTGSTLTASGSLTVGVGSATSLTASNGVCDPQVMNIDSPNNCTLPCNLSATVAAVNSVVCSGGVLSLSATVSQPGSYTYTWSGPNYSTTTTLPTVSIADVTAANSGNYSVTVTSGTGCTAVATTPIAVTVGSAPNAGSDLVLSICNNETVNLATYFPAGGTFSAPTSSSALIGTIFSGQIAQAGSFPIRYIVSATGCPSDSAIATIVVRSCSPTPPCTFPINTAVVDATCGSRDGRAQAILGGLPAGATAGFTWSNGATGPQTNGLAAGVYSVTATVTNVPGSTYLNGCVVVDTIQVNEIGGPRAVVQTITPSTCQGGGNNGAITLNITEGTGPFVIRYTGPVSGSVGAASTGATTIGNLVAGGYSVQITSTVSGESCSGYVSATVPRNDAGAIVLTATPTNATACGTGSGSIQYAVTVQSGITPPFTYLLNGQAVGTSSLPTFTLSNVLAGAYAVSVRSNAGCESTQTPVVILDQNAPAITSWTAVDAVCPDNIGSLVFAGGESATTSYRVSSLTNGATVATVSGPTATTLTLGAGTYAILRSDASSSCRSLDTLIINKPVGIHFNVQYTAVTCGATGSQADGSIDVIQIDGGTAPYIVRILDPNNVPVTNAKALAGGNYIVEVRDANGCAGIQQILITIPDCIRQCPVLPVGAVVVDANCGASDGRATVTVGGLPAGSQVTYRWSNNQNGPTAIGLSAGIYSVTATVSSTTGSNFVGCQYVKTVHVNNIGGPIAEQLAVTPSQCSASTGAVSLSVSGGTAPYAVSWTGPSTGSSVVQNASSFQVSNLATGSYTFTIMGSASSCKSVIDVTIPTTTAQDLTLAATSSNASNCGASNGSITLNVTAGNPTYTFTLNGTNYTSQAAPSLIIPNLPAGVYDVGVSLSNGCSTTATVTVGEIGAPPVSGWTKVDALCAENNGSLVFAGGQSVNVTYRVLLDGSTPIATVTGTQAATVAAPGGSYVIERTEGNCTSFQSLTVTAPQGIDFNVQYTGETCAPGGVGNGNGTIRVIQISGGTTPYVVKVTNSQNQAQDNLNALTAGIYTILITDANSCTANNRVLITVPPCSQQCPALTFNSTIVDAQCGSANGQATVTLLGAPPVITYQWSNGQNGATATGLTSGIYSVTATVISQNAIYNGCKYVDVINVNDINGPVVTTEITAAASCTNANGSVVLNITGGVAPYQVSWTGPVTTSQNVSNAGQTAITGLPAGNYVFTVTGGTTSCRSVLNVTIPQNNTTVIQLTATATNASSCGSADGSITASVSGGTAPFTYSVNGYVQLTTVNRVLTIPNLPAGTYAVSVTDASGCAIAQQNVLINENGQSPITGWTATNATCAPAGGTISYNGAGLATDQYTVTIVGTSTTVGRTAGNAPLNLTLPGGTYRITRTSSTSCVAVQTLTITQPSGLDFNVQYTQPTCTSLTSGRLAIVQPAGGTAPYSTTVTSATGVVSSLSALSAGSYTVTVGDASGCTLSQVVSLSTGVCASCFNAYVYLQGSLVDDIGIWPTNPTTSTLTAGEPLMRDNLRSLGIIPLTDPYRTAPYNTSYTHVANPYSETIVNPTVTLADRGDSSVVDWVFLEFRNKNNSSQVLYTRSALVLRNGTIVDVDGRSCLRIDHLAPDQYYVAVRHRNHLGVMTQTTRTLGAGASDLTVDFRRLTPSEIWHNTSDPNSLGIYGDVERRDMAWAPGYYALWAGDAKRDRTTIYQGQSNDVVEVFNQVITYPSNALNISSYIVNGYYSGDVNMNGQTIYQGQNNEPAIIYNIMIQHPRNFLNNPAFIIQEQLP